MNFHDPARPKLGNGAPRYEGEKVQAALPSLTISLHEPGVARLMVFLPMSPTRFRPQWLDLAITHLSAWVEEYENDPEGALAAWFGFRLEEVEEEKPRPATSKPPPAAPIGRSDANADDLGF